MDVLEISGSSELSDKLKKFSDRLVVLYFFVEDSQECTQMSNVICEVGGNIENINAAVLKMNATKEEEISKKYNITNVPAFVFISDGNIVDTLIGANVPLLTKKFQDYNKSNESLDDRLKKLINKAPVMLFMKGSPNVPRCGFSKQVIALLNSTGAQYETFDILQDFEVREGLKKYSNWPTYPQLYAKGELIGGLDILKELSETGELEDVLSSKD